MPISKIPESLLEKLKCSLCSHYLSMAPIFIQADGKNICGRCTNGGVSSSVIRCTSFEELASLHTFPCSYDVQGCLEHIPFNKMSDHEKKCIYRTYCCPVSFHSICHWKGTVSQIGQHYREEHPELYLKAASFPIVLKGDYETYNLVEVDGMVLLLQMRYAKRMKKIWFNAVYIGDGDDDFSLRYKVKLIGEDTERIVEMEDKTILPISRIHRILEESIEVDVTGLIPLLQFPQFIHCQWCFKGGPIKIALDDSIICPNCKLCMMPPIYRCPLGHVACVDCMGYNKTCSLCCETNIEFTRAIDLETLTYSTQFRCRWENCQKIFGHYNIRQHEQECTYRIFTCPECKEVIGLFDKISPHFGDSHSGIPFEIIQLDTLKCSVKTVVIFVLAHREIFKINIVKVSPSLWNVHFTFKGPCSFASLFKYQVRDCRNIVYYASKYCSNAYKGTHRMYFTRNVRCQYYLTIKFTKQGTNGMWIPFDRPSKRTRLD